MNESFCEEIKDLTHCHPLCRVLCHALCHTHSVPSSVLLMFQINSLKLTNKVLTRGKYLLKSHDLKKVKQRKSQAEIVAFTGQ